MSEGNLKKAVEQYFSDLSAIRSTGANVPETSFYTPMENLLNAIGAGLKPKVRAVSQLADIGAGRPDFGFFTADQFQKQKDDDALRGLLPGRGIVEVKSPKDDSWVTADTRQVSKYWERYGLVLVTNYRDFLLVGRDETRHAPVKLESLRLADTEREFWLKAANPKKFAEEKGTHLEEFIKRAMLHNAPLGKPEDVAWFLASYAREARQRLDERADLPALANLRENLESALGMKFTGEKGEHFFRATLIQTLFYGVFSAWVLWAKSLGSAKGRSTFNWHEAAWRLHVPMISTLFEQVATPKKLKPLGIDEVLDWVGTALNRIVREEFFRHFEERQAVQYFYEPFLKAYDPELRKELGVWYTPPEIVQYQVGRVHQLLQSELDIADGLADPRVVVLDPCCGTGAYLVEVLRKIAEVEQARGADALTAQKIKKAALKRVFGFEILPAPYVVAHLQIGLLLSGMDAPLKDEAERAGIFLTNALTGWEPLEEAKRQLHLDYPELEAERDRASEVKQSEPILVILGNPPYNAFAGTSPEEEGGLVDAYKIGLTQAVSEGGWGVRKFNLDDLYIRFFRIAERRIVKSGQGVVSFISNFSFLDGPSYVVMRQRMADSFDRIWIDCLNGDSRETGKRTPDGKPDPSVFSSKEQPVGIRVGTAIGTLVRRRTHGRKSEVGLRQYWGVAKKEELLGSLKSKAAGKSYQKATPRKENRFSFRPESVPIEYKIWPSLIELALKPPLNGPVERRGNSLIKFEGERFSALKDYLNRNVSDADILVKEPRFMRSSGEFDAPATRKTLKGVQYSESNIRPYPFKPFDMRRAYLSAAIAPLFSRPSPELLEVAGITNNVFLISRDTADKGREGPPFYLARHVCDYDFVSGHARHFPAMIHNGQMDSASVKRQSKLFDYDFGEEPVKPNLSPRVMAYLEALRVKSAPPALVWEHVLAIGYSPSYLAENADGVRNGWPRIPLPNSKKRLESSAALGQRVAALLDTDTAVKGVTSGALPAPLKSVGIPRRIGGGPFKPEEFELGAGWGRRGKDGVVMPGKGKIIERDATPAEHHPVFGKRTLDIYLNDSACWSNIPIPVWELHIGGYQVIKKWLSYRESQVLGRALTIEEIEYVTNMARRLAALVLMREELDANYEAVKADTYPWPQQA